MDGTQGAGADTAKDASLLDSRARTAAFTSLRSALAGLAAEVYTDPHLSPEARRVLRAVTRTHPAEILAWPTSPPAPAHPRPGSRTPCTSLRPTATSHD
jgi:hypothetical protein